MMEPAEDGISDGASIVDGADPEAAIAPQIRYRLCRCWIAKRANVIPLAKAPRRVFGLLWQAIFRFDFQFRTFV